MHRRQEISLNVRADTDDEMTQVAERVGQALGCTFAEGEYNKWYAEVAEVFGLKLSLVPVHGIGGRKVAKLVSSIAEKGFLFAPDGSDDVEYDDVDISAYIVDLLTIRTGLRWYAPTAEDRAAEMKGVAAFDDWLGQVGPRTTIDEEEEFPGRPRFGPRPER
ncbi:hypothetical protein [Actinokineospora fastidiosa]|uniref:Uncharacterized protein n=1 Tax=Actinokineospora fastidiosa TaxID=1816 RepID=A0A918GL36_9PSEU|nr:hypothetical protein [Actinokineospora fastidiosa]GGS45574.1 hypothetical protein GCM10010171_45840 [Actinokineospora fastidiosa]